jgi:LPS-assembly protein
MRPTPLALAAALLLGGDPVRAETPPAPLALEASRTLQPTPRGDAARQLPIILRAQSIRARPDLEAVAEGDVEFRQGATSIRADRLSYDQPGDLATARGHVRIVNGGARFSGPELQLRVQRFEGYFLEPEFDFEQLGAGGRADRVDFLGRSRLSASRASYTSCPRDGSGDPDWVLEAERVSFDIDGNEGIAEGAVLRFLGTPIVALPALSFPLTSARKSGWLPPSVNIDSRSGLELGVPYYLNIAPNRDATLVPRVMTRRGFGVDAEFRYLEPAYDGRVSLTLLPNDRVADRSREALQWAHQGTLAYGLRYDVELAQVSDDAWWKDFPDAGRSLTPRLLVGRAGIERSFAAAGGDGLVYARVQRWQVLQDSDELVTSPYQRSPQLGLQFGRALAPAGGFDYRVETELNQFTLPDGEPDATRLTGVRWHALGSVGHTWRGPGWWVTPRLAVNAAAYRTEQPMSDGRTEAQRTVPTASVGAGLELERQTEGFGRALRQTLEPRLLYVNTPYVAQSTLPNFDSAGKDFTFSSVYSENMFSGVDRVSDSHEISAGVTTRLIDAASGAEALRLGIVQRYLLREQRVTPNPDGSVDGPPLEQRFSDVLLLGSSNLLPRWTLDGSLQYSPDSSRSVRSILGARYSPGPFRTLSTTYRFARDLSEQLEVGWQWPMSWLSAGSPAAMAAASGVGAAAAGRGGAGDGCSGSWFAVGRFNYSLKDSRVTDGLLGVEYDAGCWIGRVVAERVSTGLSEATTRLMLQLELVGLSRIGSNPLKVLKDNIPGYRMLREDRSVPTPNYE